MKELSLNILDITENSVKAGATFTKIVLTETSDLLTMCISDNGCGMSAEVLKNVTDPFYTTRTTRKVGMGIPLLKEAATSTGGDFEITSAQNENHGTSVYASFNKKHIDFTPLGNVTETVVTLIQCHPNTDFDFRHTFKDKCVTLDTRQLREQLGDVPLNEYEVIKWVREYLSEQYAYLYN